MKCSETSARNDKIAQERIFVSRNTRQTPWYIHTSLWRLESWEEAMSAFLENSGKVEKYGRWSWRQERVTACWRKVKETTQVNHLAIQGISSASAIRDLCNAWSQVVVHMVNDMDTRKQHWMRFCDQFWSFCLASGCPKADRSDPFKGLEALRDLVSRQFAYTADLTSLKERDMIFTRWTVECSSIAWRSLSNTWIF